MNRLRPETNAFFSHAELGLFIAYQDGVATGRIAGIDDRRYNESRGENAAFFGYFEARSLEVARELYRAVEVWAGARGRSRLMGPFSPSPNDVIGFLIQGFDREPGFMMAYNPPEYGQFTEALGYRPRIDLYSWDLDLKTERIRRMATWAESNLSYPDGLVVRHADKSRLSEEVEVIGRVYTRAWEENWGFVPPTGEEIQQVGRQLLQLSDPELALIVEVQGRPAAIAVGIADLNQILRGTNGRRSPRFLTRYLRRKRLIDRGRIFLLGVLPEFRSPEYRVLPILARELYRGARNLNCQTVEVAWLLENNTAANRAVEWIGGTHAKTYRIYEKDLASTLAERSSIV